MADPITVIIPTYNRPEILMQALTGLYLHIKYHGDVFFLVGDDGDNLRETVKHVLGTPVATDTSVIPGPKNGLGANLNMLLHSAETDIVLQMDDDHILNKPIDINQFVEDLRDLDGYTKDIDWIRLFLGTEEDLNNDDPFYRFSAKMHGRYWIPTPGVDELYIPSNRPHLKNKDIHGYYGYYKENLSLGETEAEFCHRYADTNKLVWRSRAQGNAMHNPPVVAIPVAAPSFDTWMHVGESYQRQGY